MRFLYGVICLKKGIKIFMIILNRKRIYLLIACIVLSVGVFKITTEKNKNDVVATVALPSSNKVIVIDAGHGVPDEGAESSTRNNRSGNKLKNSFEGSKFTRTIRQYCNTYEKR